MPAILPLGCWPSFAGTHVSAVLAYAGGGLYLVIFQDKTETFDNGPERTGGARRVSHRAEQRFGPVRYSRFPVRSPLVSGGACVARRNNQVQQLKQKCSRTAAWLRILSPRTALQSACGSSTPCFVTAACWVLVLRGQFNPLRNRPVHRSARPFVLRLAQTISHVGVGLTQMVVTMMAGLVTPVRFEAGAQRRWDRLSCKYVSSTGDSFLHFLPFVFTVCTQRFRCLRPSALSEYLRRPCSSESETR